MDQNKIGKFIAKLRLKKKMTQSELGEKLGVSHKAVSKWENGICLPDPSLYNDICKLFNITKDEFFEGKKNFFNFKKIITIIILFVITVTVTYSLVHTNYYNIYVKDATGILYYPYVNGMITDSFFKDTFYLNLTYENPENHCSRGLYIKDNDLYYLLAGHNGCGYIVTNDHYKLTSEEFSKIEKFGDRGNIINKILMNKNNVYFCISNKLLDTYESPQDNDCYKLVVEKA